MLPLFLASGAAGLIYQVVWSRELVLVFGNTTQAISTIVIAVMLGLGLGGFAGGRVARRSPYPLRWYALCELLVAGFALLLPLAFSVIAEVYRTAYTAASLSELTVVRLGLALVAVAPATFLMGMTLPLLTQFLVHDTDQTGAQLAELYTVNTLGAVLGTLIAGFLAIELLGLTGTSYLAVLLNVVAGAGGLLLARGAGPAAPGPGAAGSAASAAALPDPAAGHRNLVFFATFVSGFVALSLEVLWTRLLAEGSGSRIYVFVIILALYLLGIAIGSTVYKRRSRAEQSTLTALGLCFAGVGLAAIGTVVLGSGMLDIPGGDWKYFLLLPATFLMGYAFPLAGRLVTPSAAAAGESAGLLYAWNTAGSILGAFAAAFLLAGTIGTNRSILLLAAVILLLGAYLVGIDGARRVGRQGALAALLVGAALLSVGATVARLPLTQTSTENYLAGLGLHAVHLEDNLATVDGLGGAPLQRRLYVSGVAMTTLTIDTKLMAYVPKALRPQATRFLDIAFGMGSTYRSGLILGLHTDAVELSPSVPGLMPIFFPDGDQFLHDPNGRIIIADGRNYVRLSAERYDLIAVDPPPPIQSAGTVVLYTREFFAQGKQRLNPGGIFILWIPYNNVVLNDFKDHVRTFRGVFTHVTIMFGPGHNGVYLLGSDADLTLDDASIARLFGTATAQADLAGAPDFPPTTGAGWVAVVRQSLWLSDQQVDTFVGAGPEITDDHPRSEYYLVRNFLAQDHTIVNEAMLRAIAGERTMSSGGQP